MKDTMQYIENNKREFIERLKTVEETQKLTPYFVIRCNVKGVHGNNFNSISVDYKCYPTEHQISSYIEFMLNNGLSVNYAFVEKRYRQELVR